MDVRFEGRLSSPVVHRLGSVLSIYEVFEGHGVRPRGALRRFDYYGATLVVRGSGVFRDEFGVETSLQAGSLVLTLPGVQHWFGPPIGEQWDEIYIVFNGPIFDMLKSAGVLDRRRRVIQLSDVRVGRDRIVGLAPLAPLATLMSWVAFLAEVNEPEEAASEPDWILAAQAKLSLALAQPIDFAEVAQELGLGYDAFRKRFRRLTGVAPNRYRIERRLDLSRELLARTELTLEAIAHRTGYADAFALSKAFHHEYGIWPSDWRSASLAGASEVPSLIAG